MEPQKKRPLVIGHRGAPAHAPENTMASFRKAMELGVDGLELDVQMTRDGEVVICHDEALDRTTNGHGLLASYTLAQLRELDAGSRFVPAFAGERIPTLAELLEEIKGKDLTINIELKSGVVLYPGLEARVISLVREYGLLERVVLSSFNHYSLREVKRLCPQARVGALYMCGLVDPWDYASCIPAEALHPLFYNITPELVAGAHARGMAVWPFTVDRQEDMERVVAAGVDAVITNHPDRLLDWLGRDGR